MMIVIVTIYDDCSSLYIMFVKVYMMFIEITIFDDCDIFRGYPI